MPEPETLNPFCPQLAVATSIFSAIFSVLLYIASFRKGAGLVKSACTGCVPYDFWMGRELNPRIGKWDLKVCKPP